MALCLRPGTDGALACAVMHVLFRDGHANWPYLEKYTDCPRELEAHLESQDAGMGGRHHRPDGRRDRGLRAARRHDADAPTSGSATASRASATAPSTCTPPSCIASVTGAWQHEGGGAFHNNGAIYHWDKTLIEGLDVRDDARAHARHEPHRPGPDRRPARSRRRAAGDGAVHPEHEPGAGRARAAPGEAGFARDDLFVCVHEQFMTATAEDGRHRAAGDHVPRARRHLSGRRPPAHPARAEADRAAGRMPLQPRRHLSALAKRVGATHRGFDMTAARDHRLDAAEVRLGHARRARSDEVDRLPAGFRDRALRQRLRLSRRQVPLQAGLAEGAGRPQARLGHRRIRCRALPDHWDVNEKADAAHPFRLATSPGAQLSQLVVQRDAVEPRARGPAAGQDQSRRSRRARARRWRRRSAWATSAARSRCTPKRSTGVQRGVVIVEVDSAQQPVRGRRGPQHADQRRTSRALRRRGVPRQPLLDRGGLAAPPRPMSSAHRSPFVAISTLRFAT